MVTGVVIPIGSNNFEDSFNNPLGDKGAVVSLILCCVTALCVESTVVNLT